MMRYRSNLAPLVASGVTPEELERREQKVRAELFHEADIVVIPLNHPLMKGGLKAIVEAFALTEYGPKEAKKNHSATGGS